MNRYVARPRMCHGTQQNLRARRAAAWQWIPWTKTRTDPLLTGLVAALLTSTVLSRPAPAATPTTELVSLTQSGGQANEDSRFPAISADGRYVVFQSRATNLVSDDTNGAFDVFVRDRVNGTTERVSIGQGGIQANGTSDSGVISADGRFVAFRSDAFNLTGAGMRPRIASASSTRPQTDLSEQPGPEAQPDLKLQRRR